MWLTTITLRPLSELSPYALLSVLTVMIRWTTVRTAKGGRASHLGHSGLIFTDVHDKSTSQWLVGKVRLVRAHEYLWYICLSDITREKAPYNFLFQTMFFSLTLLLWPVSWTLLIIILNWQCLRFLCLWGGARTYAVKSDHSEKNVDFKRNI